MESSSFAIPDSLATDQLSIAIRKALLEASLAFSASSSPWTIFVASKANISFAFLRSAPSSFPYSSDLFHGKKGKKRQKPLHIPVIRIDPELIIFIGRGTLGIQPDRSLLGLPHLPSVRRHDEGKGHAVGLFSFETANEIDPRHDVPPLITSSHLNQTVVVLEEMPEIVGLEQLIVKFDEGKSGFQADLHRLRRQHPVDAEMDADIPEKIDVVELGQPIGIVQEKGLSSRKIEETGRTAFF